MQREIMTNYQKADMLVRKEVVYNVTYLIQEMIGQEKYFEDLSGLLPEEDQDGNITEVLEYWLVSPRLAENLKAHGELVEKDFYNLPIWGRRTSGQSIALDTVIEDIAMKLFS